MKTTTVEEAKKQINHQIDEALYQKIRINAINRKLKLKDWITEAFEKALAESPT